MPYSGCPHIHALMGGTTRLGELPKQQPNPPPSNKTIKLGGGCFEWAMEGERGECDHISLYTSITFSRNKKKVGTFET